jgi:hypothetical protein
MITADSHDGAVLLNLNILEQLLSCIKNIRLFSEKKSPCEPGIVIHNHQYILSSTLTSSSSRTHEIHMQ